MSVYVKPKEQIEFEEKLEQIRKERVLISELIMIQNQIPLINHVRKCVKSMNQSSPDYQKSIEYLKELLRNLNKKATSYKRAKKLSYLYDEFKDALYRAIYRLMHEQKLRSCVNQIAGMGFSAYNEELCGYDTLYEKVSEAYCKFFDSLKKGENKGQLRADMYLSYEFPYKKLRSFLRNNILIDSTRKLQVIPEIIPITDENQEKVMFSTYEISDYDKEEKTSICAEIITMVMERYCKRKPVAAYTYCMKLLSKCNPEEFGKYNPEKVTEQLRNVEFRKLFLRCLRDLEYIYDVDLSKYHAFYVNAEKYIQSFQAVSISEARSRLDQLVSRTGKEVQELISYKMPREETMKKTQ